MITVVARTRIAAAPRRRERGEGIPNAGKTRRSVAAGETWIEVRVSDEDKTQLMAWSKRTGLSASLLMRRLLEEALANGRGARGDIPTIGLSAIEEG